MSDKPQPTKSDLDLFQSYDGDGGKEGTRTDGGGTDNVRSFNPDDLKLFRSFSQTSREAGGLDMLPGVVVNDRVNETAGGNEVADWKVAPSPYVTGEVFKQLADLGLPQDGWKPSNGTQRRLLEDASATSSELGDIPRNLLDGKGSRGDVTPVNEFLKSKGFDIQLRQIPEDGLAVAGTLTLEGDWRGKNQQIRGADGKDYPGFTKDAEIFEVNGKPVVKLFQHPQEGFEVFLAPAGDVPNGFDAYQFAEGLTPNGNSTRSDIERVHMPKVALNDTAQLTELLGMTHANGDHISQAVLETILNVNEHGFEAKQAMAVTTARGIAPVDQRPVFKVDQPFVLWVKHPNLDKPMVAIPVNTDSWKEPPKKG